jgi:putative Mn2+ efflux pump MntP
MLSNSLLTLFLSGLGLGLIHAFDSDHLVAVSNLSVHKPSLKKTLGYSLHWAVGHGLVLLILGLYASFLGLNIPLLVSHWAEIFVGIMLIFLGSWTLYQLYRELASKFAKAEKRNIKLNKLSKRTPLLVGVIHGTAGSATVLALIPAIQLSSPVITLSYMVFFAVGVLLSMCVFAVILSHSQQQLAKYSFNFFNLFRAFIGLFAIVLGALWLL